MEIKYSRLTNSENKCMPKYCEYSKQQNSYFIEPNHKLKVFISSKCGDDKYDKVRERLKNIIEASRLAEVYTFESEGAATLSAGSHYKYALKDSDVCIFLIDNADKIPDGVLEEIEIVKKYNIKALYYFCDEHSNEKTVLEQSLKGAIYAKSKTIHKFEDLSTYGAQSLIDDIINIYHYYCKGDIIEKIYEDKETFLGIEVSDIEINQIPIIPKSIIKNIDKCRDYIIKFLTGSNYPRFKDESLNTGEIDEWGYLFLSVLLDATPITHFNTNMYLSTLQKVQPADYHEIVKLRWDAIQKYFRNDIEDCVKSLDNALKAAQTTSQPVWVIKDILIDIRNMRLVIDTINNSISESDAQNELTNSTEELYYPILDRFNDLLHEKYINDLYKKKTESPYTITFGNEIARYCDLLASIYIISIYNGSLTHILMMYKRIQEMLFFLSSKYNDWNYRRDILKLAIFQGNEKEVNNILKVYPEILNKLAAEDAETIMKFCENHSTYYKKLISQLIGLGVVGSYLNNKDFENYSNSLIEQIKACIDNPKLILLVGRYVFFCLSGCNHRLSQDLIVDICCTFVKNHRLQWYNEMFKFIERNLDLNNMSDDTVTTLISCLISLIKDNNTKDIIMRSPMFLCVLRNQCLIATEELDKAISEYLPDFYNSAYKLETTKNDEKDLKEFIIKYTKEIESRNQRQNLVYSMHSTNPIEIINNILRKTNYTYSEEIMNSIISVTVNTLLNNQENVETKIEAVLLLTCIVTKYKEDYIRNQNVFERIINEEIDIIAIDKRFFFGNVRDVALQIALKLLFIAMGQNTYSDIIELMPFIQDDVVTIISVEKVIIAFFELNDSYVFPQKIEGVLLQNILQWIRHEYLNVRFYSTQILFAMLSNSENERIINNQIVNLVESDNVYIKNLILQNIYHKGISQQTRDHIILRCSNDANFDVRLQCNNIKNKRQS